MTKSNLFQRLRLSVLAALLAGTALAATPASAQAVNFVSQANGLYTPSFRDTTTPNANNTTWFGWGLGKFDGGANNELVENPAPTIGLDQGANPGALDGALDQTNPAQDVLSSTNNLFNFVEQTGTLQLTVPTNGTPGTGYTTIIIQGRTSNSQGLPRPLPYEFGEVGGVAPEIVVGKAADGYGQFYVKYEIEGNAASYIIPFSLVGSSASIGELQVDTKWSATEFAPDQTPLREPYGTLSFEVDAQSFLVPQAPNTPATVGVRVLRASGALGDVAATITATGSLEAGNYTAPTTVEFTDMQNVAYVSIPLSANLAQSTLPKTIVLTLSAPTNQATLGTATTHTLTLLPDGAFVIPQVTSLLTPSFRSLAQPNANNTTWFGWGRGKFDGGTDDERLNNPPPTIGLDNGTARGTKDGTLDQTDPGQDILSSTNNLFNFVEQTGTLLLTVPTNVPTGTPAGTGFTTIIIQGRTSNGEGLANPAPYAFEEVGGVAPEVIISTSAGAPRNRFGQFFVKYEIEGSAASYSIPFSLVGQSASIGELQVDTQWSATGFTSEVVLPEPAGVISFQSTGQSVVAKATAAAGNTVTVPVIRTGGDYGAVSATVTATGTLGSTFFTAPASVEFADGETTGFLTVALASGIAQSELPKTVVLTLSAPTGYASLGASAVHTITVLPNSTVSFTQTAVRVTENVFDVSVTLAVSRTGTLGAGSVQLATSGTATAGQDYVVSPTTLTWAEGETTTKLVTVTVKPDALNEGSETAVLTLNNLSGSVLVGANSASTVTIGDRDLGVPTLTLTAPTGTRLTGAGELTVAGIALDGAGSNEGIARVEIRLNGELVDSVVPNVDGAFSANITPAQGANNLLVQAFDFANNGSVAVERNFTFTYNRPLLSGAYNGLLKPVNGYPSSTYTALVNLTVLPTGGFSGKITTAGSVLPVTGVVQADGSVRFKSGSPFVQLTEKVGSQTVGYGFLALTVGLNGLTVDAQLYTSADTASLVKAEGTLDRAIYSAKANAPAPLIPVPTALVDPTREKGKYTAIINRPSSPTAPQGFGYATVTISTAGVVKFVGKTGDGETISYTNALSAGNSVPFFVQLYGKKGLIAGDVVFNAANPDNSAVEDAAGDLVWYKPAGIAGQKQYVNGFDTETDIVVSEYLAPKANTVNPNTALGINTLAGTVLQVVLEGGALDSALVEDATIDAASKVTIPADTTIQGLQVKLTAATGALSGSFKHPRTGKVLKFQGVAYQRESTAAGYFLFTPTAATPGVEAQAGSIRVTED